MSKKFDCLNQKGFTLIELISVMIIMGVVASVSIQKFDIVSHSASEKALHTAIKELNVRESLVWSNAKISLDGYTTDQDIYDAVDKDLGDRYIWNPGPHRTDGGTLHFRSHSVALSRQESSETSAAKWE